MIKGIVILFLIILPILLFAVIIISNSHKQKIKIFIAVSCNIFVLLLILFIINKPESVFPQFYDNYNEILPFLTLGLVGIFLTVVLICNLLDKNEDIKE